MGAEFNLPKSSLADLLAYNVVAYALCLLFRLLFFSRRLIMLVHSLRLVLDRQRFFNVDGTLIDFFIAVIPLKALLIFIRLLVLGLGCLSLSSCFSGLLVMIVIIHRLVIKS